MRSGAVLLVAIVALAAGPAAGEPKLLADSELDQITARGVEFGVSVNPNDHTVNFGFDLGSTFGSGSVAMSPPSAPSTLAFNGAANFSNAVFQVDNLIFNLNICVACRANTILQSGYGLGVTFKPLP